MHTKLPQSFIDELLARTDIVELINQYIPLKKQGSNYVACCPFHSEKTPSFNVIPKKQFYHCFGCGVSGNAISFVMQHLHQSFLESIETLATRIHLPIPRNGTMHVPQTRILQQLLAKVNQLYQNNLQTIGVIAHNYLKQRGLQPDIINQYQLGYASDDWHQLSIKFKQNQADLITTGMLVKRDNGKIYDRFRKRLMFPIHNPQGMIIGFGGRALDATQKPKYLNSPETVLFQKNHELYGLYHVLQNNHSPKDIIVVEGYMDVIALAEHGIANAVATLGTAVSVFHLNLLHRYTKTLFFCFDGDAAGQNAAWRALEIGLTILETGIELNFVFLPPEHDPDSFIRQQGSTAFKTYIAQALPLHNFFFNTLLSNIDQKTLSGKNQLLHLAQPYLQRLTDSSYQQLMLEELSRLTHIEAHRLHHLIYVQNKNKHKQTLLTQNKNIKRTPLRVAIALLLQCPERYAKICSSIKLNNPDLQLLAELITYIANNPQTTTMALIEHWRDTPWFTALNQLSVWEHNIPETASLDEFIDIINFLNKQNQENHIQNLLTKARQTGLTENEQQNLQMLLIARHKA